MLTEGKQATAKCEMCSKTGKGVTFKVGWFNPHLCVDCMVKVADTLQTWVRRLRPAVQDPEESDGEFSTRMAGR